ncbi:lysozyme [Methylorubrum salsuginis]|uniref:Lysozyme n=1 Tax=Methylorubrum salsuginis TaxID=414703 RepID=A0A1I4FLY2_9HYPH|nr:lysozyme [Methylorubrum salsuginis]SFL18918.1 lysozyme [Methylorubrum salsuginis]
MDLSPIGEAALIAREGRRLEAYKDSVGIWTIGVGHTAAAGAPTPRAGLRITSAECDAIFKRDVQKFVKTVRDAVPADLPQHAFDALVSLCFNIGPAAFLRSTVLRKLREGNRPAAAEAILMWSRPAVIIPRRQAEYDQFRTPYAETLPKARRNDVSRVAVAAPVAAALDPVKPTPVIEPVIVPPSTSWWGGLAGWLGGLFRSAPAAEAHAETKGGVSRA